jgi:hypothetical protein
MLAAFGWALPAQLGLLCAFAIIAGCDAHYPANAPTDRQDLTKG